MEAHAHNAKSWKTMKINNIGNQCKGEGRASTELTNNQHFNKKM